MNTLDFILENKVITIVRKVYGQQLLSLSDALRDGGIRMIECTFDQQDPDCIRKTQEAIRSLRERHGEDMMFGAGTVLTPEQVVAAYEAGAQYIISPNVSEAVIAKTKELGMISMPGAATPTEIMNAHYWGADLVKLFPAGTLGFKYIKDILAPISHVKLLAVGGVNENNVAEFLKAGMYGAGIGGNLANKKWIDAGEYHKITETARKLIEAVKSI